MCNPQYNYSFIVVYLFYFSFLITFTNLFILTRVLPQAAEQVPSSLGSDLDSRQAASHSLHSLHAFSHRSEFLTFCTPNYITPSMPLLHLCISLFILLSGSSLCSTTMASPSEGRTSLPENFEHVVSKLEAKCGKAVIKASVPLLHVAYSIGC